MSVALGPTWYSLRDHRLVRVALPAAPRAWMVALAALCVSLGFLALRSQAFVVDQQSDFTVHYERAAREILAGRGPLDANGQPDLMYPPGFPVFLAGSFWFARLTGLSETTVMAGANVVVTIASTLLVFAMGRRLWGAPGGWLSAVAWATYPLSLYLIGTPSSEVPFIFLLLAASYCLLDAVVLRDVGLGRALLGGVFIGAAMLVRPIAIGLGVLFAAALVLDTGLARPRRRTALAAALLAGNLVAIAPWEFWVYQKTGSVVALSGGSPAALRDGLTFGVRSKGFRQGTWVPDDVREVMQHVSDRYEELTSGRAVAAVMAKEFADHPVAVVKLYLLKAARSWYGTDSQRSEGPLALLQAFYLGLLAASTVIAWRSQGVARRLAVSVWTIACYFWAMTIASTTLVRYMTPVMSLLFLLLPAWLYANPDRRDARTYP